MGNETVAIAKTANKATASGDRSYARQSVDLAKLSPNPSKNAFLRQFSAHPVFRLRQLYRLYPDSQNSS